MPASNDAEPPSRAARAGAGAANAAATSGSRVPRGILMADDTRDNAQPLSTGFNHHLAKPVDPARIGEILQAFGDPSAGATARPGTSRPRRGLSS